MNKKTIKIINAAIHQYLPIGPSENWHYKNHLRDKYGDKIYNIIEDMLGAIDIYPNWEIETYEGFIKRLNKLIEESFPILDERSVRAITSRISYDYK